MTGPRMKTAPESNLDRRVPPNSPEAEMAVLGGVLLSNSALDQVRDLLDAEHFYQPAHQRIFRVMIDLYDHSKPIDLTTLRTELKDRGQLEEAGGADYMMRLLDEVHTTANIEHYARMVAEKWLLRRLLDASLEIQGMVYEGRGEDDSDLEVEQILDRSQQKVFEVVRQTVRSPYESLEEVIHESLKYVDERRKAGSKLAGYTTGFTDLDNITNGFKPGELILLAARPAMGKTSLALNIATYLSMHENLPVLIFSLEMNAVQIGLRLLCSQAKVNLDRMFKGMTTDEDFLKLAEHTALLAEAPLFIDDSGNTTINTIRAKARRLRAEKGTLGLVVIDYIQLLGSSRQFESREREIAAMSRQLKMMAKDLNCPILALSQLNRQLEARPIEQRRPRPSDLRESGSLEQDADVILFLYRESVYKTEEEIAAMEEPKMTEVIIGKQRSGPPGAVEMVFQNEYARFEQYVRRDRY